MGCGDNYNDSDIEAFEFQFFLAHGYMPNAHQKAHYQKAKSYNNNDNDNTNTNDTSDVSRISDEEAYREFEAALPKERNTQKQVQIQSKATEVQDSCALYDNTQSGSSVASEASDSENYNEFERALAIEDGNVKPTKSNKPKQSTTTNTTNTNSKQIAKQSYKQNVKIVSSVHENIESPERLYSLLKNAIDNTTVDSNVKVDSVRKGKDYYTSKKPSKNAIDPEDRIDLHGDTQAIAKSRLNNFLHKSISNGYTQVLVIHGKGRNSVGGIAVLKDMVEAYAITEGKHLIKNMTEAPSNFGGGGAKIIWL